MIVAAALAVLSAAADLPVVFLNGGVLLILIAVTGSALVMARFLVIEYAPWFGHHSKAMAHLLDVELDLIEVAVDVVRVAVEVVFAAVDLLSGKKPHFTAPKWHENVIDPAELVAITHELSYGCRNFDSFDTIVVATTTQLASPFVCPIIRHTYPVQGAFNAITSFSSFLSYDPTPPPFGGNCEPPDSGVDPACIAFGAGYILLELILPIYIILLVGQSGLWTALIKLIFYAIPATVLNAL